MAVRKMQRSDHEARFKSMVKRLLSNVRGNDDSSAISHPQDPLDTDQGTFSSDTWMERAVRSVRQVDERVVDAMLKVPRHEFVDVPKSQAYENRAISIGYGQTISQPSLVAHMVSQLCLPTNAKRVLDVGAGSGYQSAILSLLCEKVIAVERIPQLASTAKSTLKRLGYHNVEIHVANKDVLGYPPAAPYDGIIVGATAPEVPESLCNQLKPGARMVIPVGKSRPQQISITTRHLDGDGYSTQMGVDVVFVPLIGPDAW